jgi:hypothetical protein
MNDRQRRMLPKRYAKRVVLHHNIKFVEKYISKIDGMINTSTTLMRIISK